MWSDKHGIKKGTAIRTVLMDLPCRQKHHIRQSQSSNIYS